MRHGREEPFHIAHDAIDFRSAVRGLHGLSSEELHKLLNDSENFTISYVSENGSSVKIDAETFARLLPLHLTAVLMICKREEALFRYILSGVRLLYSLCILSSRHSKLDQVLNEDIRVAAHITGLVFHLLTVLAGYRQEMDDSSLSPLLHSALLPSSLYLLSECMSSQWNELAQVLLAHPKVDLFMDVSFGAVCVAIDLLQIKLSTWHASFCNDTRLSPEQIVSYICHQCEASLHFLQSLCQEKMFRERLLRNKALCGKGGILFLAWAIMKLNITAPFENCSAVVASLSRLKSKMLSILLHLCEGESIFYLDEVASSQSSLDLAKSVAVKVFELLKIDRTNDPEHLGATTDRNDLTGLLQLNAMRIADVFSDDSNFRSFVTMNFTETLVTIFLLPHGEFLSCWCSSDLPKLEEDYILEYDSFATAGWVLDIFLSSDQQYTKDIIFTSRSMVQSSYSHQRTALLVKIIANLHCFIPTVCEEQERNFFLHKFLEYLRMDSSKSSPGPSLTPDAEKATTVCKNLFALLSHARSLTPNFLNEDDVHLLRAFSDQLQALITPAALEENQVQEAQSAGICLSPLPKIENLNLCDGTGNLKEATSDNSVFQEPEQLCVRSKHLDQSGGLTKQDREEDKVEFGTSAPGGQREMGIDVQNVEISGSETSSTRDKKLVYGTDNSELPKSSDSLKENQFAGAQEDEKAETGSCEEKRQKKRKRSIMNDEQVSIIEKALLGEPDMQRNAASIQSWAEKLSLHGSEVTSSQLKNWLNNRKAKLARAASSRHSDTDSKHAAPQGPNCDSQESAGTDARGPSAVEGRAQAKSKAISDVSSETSLAKLVESAPAEYVQCEPGQHVVLVDGQGKEIGKGKVHRVQGKWHGRSLEESETCVIDVTELKTERCERLPYSSEAIGASFDEAERKFGVMRVMWDSNKIFMLRSTMNV